MVRDLHSSRYTRRTAKAMQSDPSLTSLGAREARVRKTSGGYQSNIPTRRTSQLVTARARSRSATPEIPSRSSSGQNNISTRYKTRRAPLLAYDRSTTPDAEHGTNNEDSSDDGDHGYRDDHLRPESDDSADSDFVQQEDDEHSGKHKQPSAGSQLRDLARESTITISTTSGSHASHVPQSVTQRHVPTRQLSLSLPTSGVGDFSSPLGPLTTGRPSHRNSHASARDGRSSSSYRDNVLDTTGVTSSRKNMLSGPERVILETAKGIVLHQTLFVDPFPGAVGLTSMVHMGWDVAHAKLSESGYFPPSRESIHHVC